MTDIAERLRQPALVWAATYGAASLAMLNGKAEEAERLATTAMEVGTKSGQPDAFQFYGSQLMYIRWMQGRLGELVPLISRVAENAPLPVYNAVLAAAHLDAGDETVARALLEEGASTAFEMPEDQAWFDGIVTYARTVFELRQVQYAAMLMERLQPFHEQVPHNALLPQEPVAMYLGALATVLRHFEEAEGYFEEAAELNRRGEMRFAETHTYMLWGRMLRQRCGPGDAERARKLLGQARESATTLGYTLLARRANTELAALA